MGDRLLPLFFVSPGQISAQLPVDLPEGPAALAVRWGNRPELRGDFTVMRNAPGLFHKDIEDRPYAVAVHEDGSLVTADAPARRGERVTVYGTGFGPTDPQRPLGFAVPAMPAYSLIDRPMVRIGDIPVSAEAAFAAPGRVGVDAVQFRVPETASGPASIVLSSGGQDSNPVLLAVE
jgi:uncharacterized protein (TIGR03437 family)